MAHWHWREQGDVSGNRRSVFLAAPKIQAIPAARFTQRMGGQQLVAVQIGQCGNQLGHEYFSTLACESGREPGHGNEQPLHENLPACFRAAPRPRTRGGGGSSSSSGCGSIARAVLLDAEPRVIANSVARAAQTQQWRYAERDDELQRVWKSVGASGSANNWAFGYYRQGPALAECALEMMRREAEHCDRLSGFLFFQSLSGGTGSGAGSLVTELLRDEYPCCCMSHSVVWPSRRGEVVVQSYNATLSLAHLLRSTDALLALVSTTLRVDCISGTLRQPSCAAQ